MKGVNKAGKHKKIQHQQQLREIPKKQKQTQQVSTFEGHIQDILGKKGKKVLNEEDLFAGTINHRLNSKKGQKAAQMFRDKLKQELSSGDMSLEDAASKALKKTRVAGLLTNKEAQRIRQESFQASQLDNNFYRLYNSDGNRVAKLNKEEAFTLVQKRLAAMDDGSLHVQTKGERMAQYRAAKADGSYDANVVRTEDTSGTLDKKGVTKGNPSDGSHGFLYKPISDHGNLVILMPNNLKGDVSSVVLRDRKGKVLETGRSTGYANGDREHFRFNQNGGDYPNDITVEVQLNSGKKIHYAIQNSAQRYD